MGSGRGSGEEVPLTYLAFSSSFICSARSRPVLWVFGATSGVPVVDTAAEESLDLLAER